MDRAAGKDIKTIEIRIYGIVQGVGFRPFIANLASACHIAGEVRNNGGFVTLTASGDEKTLNDFIKAIVQKKPRQSEIVHIETKQVPYRAFESFSILKSQPSSEHIVMLPPDLAVCDNCLSEMHNINNPRYLHPFISCTDCGPRYSIIDSIPYDRCNTTMDAFTMCKTCYREYTASKDRRYHAQTISCKACGPYLIFRGNNQTESINEAAFSHAVSVLKSGGILALKGIGGYQFCCSPFHFNSVAELRNIKKRQEKPFAVMFLNIEQIKAYCEVSEKEEALLESNARPIVLLERKKSSLSKNVYQNSPMLGAFIPYTPLHHRLLEACGPLVMTSANISGAPIIKDEKALFGLQNINLQGILYNERQIKIRLDDSVAKISGDKVQLLRRARGYVPLPVYLGKSSPEFTGTVFAAGGHLKASFCFVKGPFAYMSEYLGDMEYEENTAVYKESYQHMKQLFQFRPELSVADLHPRYFTSGFVSELGSPVVYVQHHHAHIASVMAEHHLEQTIGVAFDGTGYGTDGAIWGGEFFVCIQDDYERKAHLNYVTLIGGDASMKDAKKTADCYLISSGITEEASDARWPVIKAALENHLNTYACSSMGRLLDAISSLLGICHYNHFEGEAAISLETYAEKAKKMALAPIKLHFEVTENDEKIMIDQTPLLREIIRLKSEDIKTICALALGVHLAVAEMIIDVVNKISEKSGLKTVALSGGVFQNTLLMERCLMLLQKRGYKVYTNQKVPPNDGGIALGQAYIGTWKLKKG